MKSKAITLVLIVPVLIVIVAGITTIGRPDTIHAQISCDAPPFDVSRIATTWNLTDFCTYQEGVWDEIISGGVPRDGIPPIDDPSFESIESASDWLEDQSPVISLEINGDARAYPLGILTRHEIVNDMVGDMPIAVTFCPLCNSAIVFDRVVDGETYRFGVSGLLRNSDLIMWDRQTQSWWQQFTGTGIVGVHTGTQLEIVPSQVVGFGAFVEQYPDGQVLSQTGRGGSNRNPYVGYDSNPDPFLFLGEPDPRLFPTSRILGTVVKGEAVAYPFETLEEEIVINDTINDRDIVVFWQPGNASALDGADISTSRDVGMAGMFRREFNDMLLTFYVADDSSIHDEQTNSVWNVFGTAIEGELEGSQLRQENAFPHFWFAWAAFQPETTIYGFDED